MPLDTMTGNPTAAAENVAYTALRLLRQEPRVLLLDPCGFASVLASRYFDVLPTPFSTAQSANFQLVTRLAFFTPSFGSEIFSKA